MNDTRTRLALLLAAALHGALAMAVDAPAPPGAKAAVLERQAATMEAGVEKDCLKVAPQARRLCREQHGAAIKRLRAQAARLR